MTDDSICPKEKYCQFEIVLDNREIRKEVCTFCGKRVFYNKIEGERIDNRKYLRDHVRDFCQPHGATAHVYREIYGDAAVKRHGALVAAHAKKPDMKEAFREARDALKTMKKLDIG